MPSFRLAAPVLGAALALGACTGGSTSLTAPPAAQTSAAQTGAATSNAQLAVAPLGAITAGTITLPAVTSGSGTLLTVKTLVGSGATQRISRRSGESIANANAFAEVVLTAAGAVTFTGSFVANITYAGGPSTYFGTFEDPDGNLSTSTQMTPVGSVYTDTSPSATYTLAAGGSVAFDFGTSGPNGAGMVFGSPSLSFLTTTGTAAAQTDAVTEAGYTGSFTVSSENTAVATASISGGTVTVTAVGPGTTSIDVAGGVTGKISITVTTSPVTVN